MHVFVGSQYGQWVRGSLLQHTARETLNIQTSTMDLSSLNVDVLLYLMEFVKPVDRFNLVLSGILKGFENANEGIDLRERYSKHFTVVQCVNQILEMYTAGIAYLGKQNFRCKQVAVPSKVAIVVY